MISKENPLTSKGNHLISKGKHRFSMQIIDFLKENMNQLTFMVTEYKKIFKNVSLVEEIPLPSLLLDSLFYSRVYLRL